MRSPAEWIAYWRLGRPTRGHVQVHPRGTFAFEEGADLWSRVRRAFGPLEQLAVIDLGSGPGETVIARQVLDAPWRRLASIEPFLPYVHRLRQKTARAARHDIYELRIEQVFSEFAAGEFDVALLIDVLEHFEPRSAWRLLVSLERFVRRGVVIFVPLGEVPKEDLDGNALQRHRSVWRAEMLARLGYDVEVFEAFHGQLDPPATAAWAIRVVNPARSSGTGWRSRNP